MTENRRKHLQAFHRISKEPRPHKEVFQALSGFRFGKEAKGYPDQAVVLIATALVEQVLGEAVATHFPEMDDTTRRKLFYGDAERDAIIGTIYARTVVARGFGILTPKMAEDLNILRLIRNRFAHATELVQLDTEPLAPLCDFHVVNTAYGDGGMSPRPATPRGLLLAACELLINYSAIYVLQGSDGLGVRHWRRLWA